MEQITNEAMIVEQQSAPAPAGGGKRLKKGGGERVFIAVCIVCAVVLLGYLGLCAYAGSLDTFYPGYRVNGIDVGGLTVAQAQEKIETELLAQIVEITNADTGEQMTMTLEELGYTPELLDVAQIAMDDQRSQSFPVRGANFLGALFSGHEHFLWHYLSEEALLTAGEQVSETLSVPVVDASYAVGENSISVVKPQDGYALDAETAAAGLQAIDRYSREGYRVTLDFHQVPAKVLTAREIHAAVAGEMKNAGYDAATDTITPEQMGADFDISAAQKAIDAAEPGSAVEIPARIQRPAVTAEALKAVLFRDVLGEAKTNVSGTNARKTNVRLSASTINNFVMNTGDVFSYNEVVGKRTVENGYQAAPAYVHGETVDEIGGGICQTSSTLYKACLLGNLEITERYAHRYVPAYIDWGMDATVSWGGPDYKFTNNTDYPVKIVTEYVGNTLTVKLLGTNVDGSYARMSNKVLSNTPWETVYEEDPTLAPGKEEVKTSPYTGYKVETYQTIYDKDGKVIDSHFEATSNYKVRNKVILRGPAAAVVAPVVPVTPMPAVPVMPEEEVPPSHGAFTPVTPEEEEADFGFIFMPME